MTAEKHPLEIVRDQLKAVLCDPQGVCCISGSDADRGIVDNALTTLTTYMGQTQSCAECERLGRENARLREAVRDLGNMLSDVGPAFEALHDEWIEIEGCEPYQPILDQVAEIKHMLFEKHAATIAAAGGDDANSS